MHRAIINKAEACQECTKYGKNVKTLKAKSDWENIPEPTEPNEELQIDFAGPFCSKKHSKYYILVAVDRYSRFPSAMITKATTATKVIKFLTSYIALHGVPENIKTDQFSSFKSSEYKLFCDNQNINRRYCPVDDHRANGVVERCIQSVKRRLGTMLCEKGGNVEAALTAILSSIRKSKHAITKKSPHYMHFGRAANTPLSILHDKVAISDKGHLKRSMLTKEQKKEDSIQLTG